MFKLFGSKKKQVDTTQTVFNIKETILTLEKRRDFIEKNIETERKKAKEYIQYNNRERALFHLKKVKMYEKEQKMLDGNIFNLESQRLAIESHINIKSTMDALKLSSETLKEIIKPTEVSNLMDDISELMQSQQEVSEELARPIINYDEDDLLEELDKLSTTEAHEIAIKLPSVPTHKPVILSKTDEEELEELKLMMTL
jgi:hypothetical protein